MSRFETDCRFPVWLKAMWVVTALTALAVNVGVVWLAIRLAGWLG